MFVKIPSVSVDKFSKRENHVLWNALRGSRLPYLDLAGMSSIDKEVVNVLRELEQFQIGSPRMRNIPPMVGQLLNMLVKVSRAQTIVELGTANGYSTLWLACAARHTGGHVITYEKYDWKAEMATANIAKAGLQGLVTVVSADALDKIPEISGTIDFAFLDIWSGDYVPSFHAMKSKLRLGSLIVADNIVAHRDREGIPIPNEGESDEYISLVRNSPNMSSAFIPIGSGLEITYIEE